VTLFLAYAERPDDQTDAERFVRETYVLEVHPGPAPESRAHGPREQRVSIATAAWPDGELDVVLHPRRMLRSADDLLEIVHGLVRRVQALEQRR